ncbi:Cupredoxin [Fusarium avenaceum]|nr:Cupredoxin [Fusarium avenaceum]
MVARDEEAHALLEEHELYGEDTTVRDGSVSSSTYPALPSHFLKKSCTVRWIAALIVVSLLSVFGAIITSYGTREQFSENGQDTPLAYQLHAHEHTSRPPTTLVFSWNVTAGLRSPDGVEKRVYLINDEFPGPLIEARSSDRVVVHVHNGLSEESLSIHWHGLRMKDQNVMDDGLWGGLVVHSPDEINQPPEDHLIMIGDWFHRNQTEVLSWFADASSRGNEPVPDSLLVNGQGRFDCSMAVPARPVVCSQIAVKELKPLLRKVNNEKTRIRVVNTGSIAGFTMRMDGAMMRPVRVDGGFDVHSEATENVGILYPGERVDIDVEWMDNHSQGRWLTIYMDDENFGYTNEALNPVQSFPILHHGTEIPNRKDLEPNETQILDPRNLKAAKKVVDMPSVANQTILLYAKTEKLAHMDYEPVGFINHTSWKPQSPPLISQNRSDWDEHQLIPFIATSPGNPTRVDIVINNLDDGAHPFHLHGHSFYVLSTYRDEGRGSWGSYNSYSGEAPPNGLDLDFSLRKDTVSVPRRGHVVLTFVADNPGIWALHCHMLVHMARGMAMGLHVDRDLSASGL